MNMLNNAPAILPLVEQELVAHSPATMSELLAALEWRRVVVSEIELAAALAVLISRGKVEVLPAVPERNRRYAAR